jgi:2-aminoadipate transaminase
MPTSTPPPAPGRPAFAKSFGGSSGIAQRFLSFGGRTGVASLAGGLSAAESSPVAAIETATHRALARHGAAALECGAAEGSSRLERPVRRHVDAGRRA